MPPTLHPESEGQQNAFGEQMAEIHSALKDAVGLLHHQGNDREWKPAAGSPAALDLADTRWRSERNRPHSPMHWGYSVCQLRIVASADFLDALADVVATWPPSAFAPSVLARATIEASARAAWLLDRKVKRQDRASRMLADRLAEEKERYQVDRATGRSRVLEVVKVADAYGIELNVSPEGWPRSVVGVEYPKLGEIAPQVLPNGHESLAVWKSYANLSHGSPFSVLSRIEMTPDDDSPDSVGTIRVSLRDIASVSGTALYSFLHVLDLYGVRYGWNKSARWERGVDALIDRLKEFLSRHATS